MKSILDLLNIDKVWGHGDFVAISEWTTPHGMMGIYQSDSNAYSQESQWLIVQAGEKWYTRVYPRHNNTAALNDIKIIAAFAGAEEHDPIVPTR